MARWILMAALVSGAAMAQVAPITAAEAAAHARGDNSNGTATNASAATATSAAANSALPSPDKVQSAQDQCPAGESDCARKLREPAPSAPATSTEWTKQSASESAAAGLFGSELVGLGSPALNAPGGMAGAAAVPSRPIELSSYFILNGQWVQQDPNYLYVGRNNGFSLADARIEVTGRPSENLWLFLSIDGAVANRSASDPSQGTRVVALKDAYGVYAFNGFQGGNIFTRALGAMLGHLRIQAGQFKAPQDVEHLLEETEIKFPSRSLVTDGLHAPAGYETNGLSLDRQIGIAIGTDVITLPFGSIAAQVAVTNGNGANTLFNGTSIPGVVGRVAIGLFGFVSLGGDAYFMPQATGTQPDLFRDNWVGAGGDIRVEWNGLHVMALVQWRNTQHITSGAPDEVSLGYSAEAAYRLPGALHFIEPAVRYASLNPSDKIPTGQIQSLDAALNLYAPGLGSGRLSIAYVHRMEDTSRTLQNDGLDLSMQVRF